MDWVPVNLDSPAGEAEQQSFRTKFLLKNFCSFTTVIEPVIASFQKEPYSTAMTVSPRPALYIYSFVVLSQNLSLKHVGDTQILRGSRGLHVSNHGNVNKKFFIVRHSTITLELFAKIYKFLIYHS